MPCAAGPTEVTVRLLPESLVRTPGPATVCVTFGAIVPASSSVAVGVTTIVTLAGADIPSLVAAYVNVSVPEKSVAGT